MADSGGYPNEAPPPPTADPSWNRREVKSSSSGGAAWRYVCCLLEGMPAGDDRKPRSPGFPGPPPDADGHLSGCRQVPMIGHAPTDKPDGHFDAHAHLFDFNQRTEGIDSLVKMMDECNVSHATLMGTSLKKMWSEFEERMAPDPFNDTDTLYYYSATDLSMLRMLKTLPPLTAARFAPSMCGFRPTDKASAQQIEEMINTHPEVSWRSLGEVHLRSSELTNLTCKPVPNPASKAFNLIMQQANNQGLPVLICHKACSESAKPYKYGFDFLPELDNCLEAFPKVEVLWIGAGIYVRGQWTGYKEELDKLLTKHANLYLSITAEILRLGNVPSHDLIKLAEKHPKRFMVGTSTYGFFDKGDSYKKDWEDLKGFLGHLTPATSKMVKFENAYNMFTHKLKKHEDRVIEVGSPRNADLLRRRLSAFRVNPVLHGHEEAAAMDKKPPPEKQRSLKGMENGVLKKDNKEIKHVTIDCHLHMLDFLHKSSGTRKIMEAMDGCGVAKAVLVGMPCCKKWSKDEPEKPLYYQDDNGQCYVYAYSDQMVADAWLALPNDKRARFAPVMAAFNPTDLNAIEHVQRMWDKYPGMWRGLGEVMCRHDDLTMLLQEDETPVINHMAMRALFQFCIKHDINCMVHHNSVRTFKRKENGYEYTWEVEEVLDTFPDLKLVWCHAGASRRTHQENHHEMIGKLVSKYPKLMIDISWVVWEEVICEPSGKPKDAWINLFEKHPTRFTMGSDQVGQFIGPSGANLLKGEITKYWVLAEHCSPATAKAIFYENSQRIWFEGWDFPKTNDKNGRFHQIPPCNRAETLMHNQGFFQFDGEFY